MSSDPPILIRRNPRARRVRLSVDPRDGQVWLTLPPRASEARARAFAEGHRDWIARAVAGVAPPRAIVPGGRFPFRGEELAIDWAADAPRTPVAADGRLRVGGPAEMVERRVLAWARRQALALLDAETRLLAAREGIAIGRVAVGDPRSRWGSCTTGGDVRYSWRLVMAPPFVLSGVVAHEVAHRLHMDHSPAFRAAEARLLGADPAPGRAWLRAHGAALYRIGRASSTSSTGTPSTTG